VEGAVARALRRAEHIDLALALAEKLNVLDINPDHEEGYYTGQGRVRETL
jgi:hypothetical protein